MQARIIDETLPVFDGQGFAYLEFMLTLSISVVRRPNVSKNLLHAINFALIIFQHAPHIINAISSAGEAHEQ